MSTLPDTQPPDGLLTVMLAAAAAFPAKLLATVIAYAFEITEPAY